MSQLSDKNVSDLILRAQMYRDIRKDITSGEAQAEVHEIKEDELYRSDLISFRNYGRSDLAWLVDLVCDREDIANPHVIGLNILLPDSVYIRSKIKFYSVLHGQLTNG